MKLDLYPHIALSSLFPSQMAVLGFSFPLSLSLMEQVTLWLRIIPLQSERERERPPLHRELDLNPRSPNYKLSVLYMRPRRHPKNDSGLRENAQR